MIAATRIAFILCAICAAASAAVAQSDLVAIPKDTLVKLRFTDPVSTRDAKEGQTVNMRVADDVYLGTRVVIRKDQPTVATVTEARGPKRWGRSGKLVIEFGTVEAVDGTEVYLGPLFQQKEESLLGAAGASVGGAIILGPVGLVGGMFVKGRHIDIPAGQETHAGVRWEVAIQTGEGPSATGAPSVSVPAPTLASPEKVQAAVAPAPAGNQGMAKPKPAPAVKPAAKAEQSKPDAKQPETAKSKPAIPPVIPVIEDVEE